MKKGIIVILLLACAAGAGGGIFGQMASVSEETQSTGAAMSDISVPAASTVSGIVNTRLAAAVSSANLKTGISKYPVTVERQETRKVTSSSSRKVSDVLVKVGDSVQEGTVLMRYDDENDQMTIQNYEYDIEKARLSIETRTMSIQKAETELSKLKGIELEQKRISISQARNQISKDEYNIEIREKNIETLRQMIQEKEIKSKYVGVVTKVQKGNGNSNSDSDTDTDTDSDSGQYTITIAESQNLLLKGTIAEADAASLSQGMNVVAFSRVDPDKYWFGMIGKVKKPGEDKKNSDSGDESYTDSSGSSQYTYYVELESEEGLLVGQHLYIEPDRGQAFRTEGLWLGENYIFFENGKAYVWAENNNRLEKRAVTVSKPDDYGVFLVTEGLDKLEYIAPNDGTAAEGKRTRHADEAAASNAGGQQNASGMNGSIDSDYDEDMAGMTFDDEWDALEEDFFDGGDYGDDDFGDDDYGDDDYGDDDFGDDDYGDDDFGDDDYGDDDYGDDDFGDDDFDDDFDDGGDYEEDDW